MDLRDRILTACEIGDIHTVRECWVEIISETGDTSDLSNNDIDLLSEAANTAAEFNQEDILEFLAEKEMVDYASCLPKAVQSGNIRLVHFLLNRASEEDKSACLHDCLVESISHTIEMTQLFTERASRESLRAAISAAEEENRNENKRYLLRVLKAKHN